MKEKIAGTIILLLENTPLSKITIKEIVDLCGVSRQIFYYYFEDIYDAVKWILLEKANAILEENSDISNWKYGYIFILNWICRNKNWMLNLYKSVNREYIDTFLYEALYPYIVKVVEEEAAGLNVTDDQKAFVAKYFTLSFNAISLDWIKRGMPEKPDELVERVTTVISGDFKKALKKFEKGN